MNTSTTGRAKRLIVLSTVAGVALGATPAFAASAEPAESAVPKNVIVLISDGGGYNQYDAARLYESGTSYQQVDVDPATGAVEHIAGEPTQVYDEYPVQLGQSHYSANGRASYTPEEAWGDFSWVAPGATDSAAAGTALGTGVKTNNGVLGLNPAGDQLLTVGEQAKQVGKKLGLVTDVTFNHATPAGFIAHNSNRNDYHGLATEMIDSGADVLIGAGHPNYTDANKPRSSHFGNGSWISQTDFDRLVKGETDFSYIESKSDFEAVAAGENVPDKLFGLARVAETFQYNRPGLTTNNAVVPFTDAANTDVPSLTTAAKAALNVLDQDEEGFFLMVEAGAVDWAGHANQTTRIVEEQVSFNRTVEAVNEWVETNSNWDETLVVVTADHETGYLAGPESGAENGWTALTGEKGELPAVKWHSGGHTNALVPLYAKGAGSEILEARATNWDFVRGAYLDNTDVGETIFDILGHEAAGENGIGVEATVPLPAQEGELSLAVPTVEQAVAFAGDGASQSASLPEITVNDSRNEAQSQGKGWTLSGSASAFVAGNREFGAENLSWTPRIVNESGAVAGATATLEAPATIAGAGREERVGETVVGADLDLSIPADAKSGRYGSEITLTLFAQD